MGQSFSTNEKIKITYKILAGKSQGKTLRRMKMRAFWNIVPFGLVEVDRRFRGAYFLHHHGDEISHSGESGKILHY
jgi:hypothetical protein